jgi:excisionase family DNA binding protein
MVVVHVVTEPTVPAWAVSPPSPRRVFCVAALQQRPFRRDLLAEGHHCFCFGDGDRRDALGIHDSHDRPPGHRRNAAATGPSLDTSTQDRLAYSPTEAAHVLGVSRSLFYELVLPQLKTVRIGRKRLVAATELQRFLDVHGSKALP